MGMYPSSTLTTLLPVVSGSLMEFDLQADRGGFIGMRVLPIFNAPEASGTFGKMTLESLLENRDTKRAPGSGYSRSSGKFEQDTFTTQEHGAEEVVDQNQEALYHNFFDAAEVAAMRARDVVLRNHEKLVADTLFNAVTFTPTNVTNEWDDAANATPLVDVEARVEAIYDATGLWPNSLVMNYKVFRNLRNCDSIIERINSSGAGSPSKATDVTIQMLSQVFALDNILVAGGTKNTAGQGLAAVPGQIWSGEYVGVGRIATTNDIIEPCIGRTFHWSADGSTPGGTIETYEEPRVRGNVIRVRHQVGTKILYPETWQLLDNITT